MQDPTVTGVPMLEDPVERAIVGAVFVVIALVAAPFALWLARRIAGPRERVVAGWNIVHAGAVAAVFIGLNLLVYAVFSLAFSAARRAPVEGAAPTAHDATSVIPLLTLAASVAIFGLTAAFAYRCARATTPDAWTALGLRGRGVVRAVATVFVLFPLAYLLQAGLALLWQTALRELGWDDIVQPVARMLQEIPHDQRWIAALVGVLVMPLLEEFVFRGFLQPALERHVRPWPAIFLTSLAFGAMHGVVAVVPIAGLSLVLGYARQRTGSLWAAFALHALNNALAFLVLWYAPASPAA